METLTRRHLFRFGVGAALMSGLQSKARTRDITKMPLVIDCIGPMAFYIDKTDPNPKNWVVRIFLPKLVGVASHDAGVGTSVSSTLLSDGDYDITGPSANTNDFNPYGPLGSGVYQNTPVDYSAKNRRFGLTIPLPKKIVGLVPVLADVYPTNQGPSGSCLAYAVGLRFLYDKANTPQLVPKSASPQQLYFDPALGEIELNISIGYSPTDYNNGDGDAQSAFNQLSKLFPNLDLSVHLYPPGASCVLNPAVHKDWHGWSGPQHDCKAPIILLT